MKHLHLDWLKATKKNQLAFLLTRLTIVPNLDMPEKLHKLCRAHIIEVDYSRVVMLRADYLKLLNKKLADMGEPPVKKTNPLPWGEWEIEGVLINHHGSRYLRYYPYNGELQYVEYDVIIDGESVIDENFWLVENWLSSQPRDKNIVHNVNVNNIRFLTLLTKSGDPDADIIFCDDEKENDEE